VALDEHRLRYWQVVGFLRNLVTCLASISNPVRGRDHLVHHLLLITLNRLVVDSLARIEGIELPPAPALTRADPLPGSDVVEEIAEELNDMVAALEDPELRQRARRMRYFLGQLAETWSLAPQIAQLDAEDGPRADEDAAAALRRLARAADRRLELFPRATSITRTPVADFS
jgi:hypothetical protein